MLSEFDCEMESECCPGLEYGIIKGDCRIAFMKLPMNETIWGYRNKYAKMARDLNKIYCHSVICAETLGADTANELKSDLNVLEGFVKSRHFCGAKYNFIGIGEGANYGLSYLYDKIDFEKMLLINMPITHELGQTIDLLNGVDRNKLKFVYGDGDPSYRYTPLLKRLYADVVTIKGADHNFTGMTDMFVDLKRFI